VLATGEPELIEDIGDDLLAAVARDGEHLRLLRAIGLRSLLIVPLRFGERVIGTMSFVLAEQDRRFSDADVSLATELARRAVVAIENARLYTERERISRALQEGLLPPGLEAPPGWDTAVLFRAAGTENEVGGDFYDVVRLRDGWVGFVGDVAGKGAAAAALTARARYTMISVAQFTGDVTAALERVNLALVELGGLPFCTAACARLRGDPPDGSVEVLSAGHPLPLVVGNAGVAPVGKGGPLLGYDPHARWPRCRLTLDPGEAIVLYSDGGHRHDRPRPRALRREPARGDADRGAGVERGRARRAPRSPAARLPGRRAAGRRRRARHAPRHGLTPRPVGRVRRRMALRPPDPSASAGASGRSED
jgi:Stage II sporulation protein E (SpoIIE)/GAF domain